MTWENRLGQLESFLASTHGGFLLFAAIIRVDSPERWDLLVSAPWLTEIPGNKTALINSITSFLTKEEISHISRVVFLDQNHPVVNNFRGLFNVEHGKIELTNVRLNDLQIEKGFLFTFNAAVLKN